MKVFRTPLSYLTLSILPIFFRTLKRLGVPAPRYILAFCPDGSRILYPIFSSVGIHINLLEIYGNREYFLLFSHIPRKGDIIIDCGAYIGLYSIISSKLSGNDGKIISIEPNPSVFEHLRRNIQLNKIENSILLNIALADREGEMEFFIPKVSAAGSTFYLEHLSLQKVAEFNKMVVKTMTLDKLILMENLNRVNIVKIDVEGAELLVLRGAQNALKSKKIDKLIVEIHKTINPPKEVIDFLLNKGYNINAYFDINEFKGMLYASAYITSGNR
jgi:FkbM family methyltransferase